MKDKKLPLWKITLFWSFAFVACTVIALLLAEVYLRKVYNNRKGYYVFPARMHKVFRPMPGIMPGITGHSRFITNSDGIRGDETSAANTHRILVIGGSAVECLYLDQDESWPQLLQHFINSRLPPGQNVWVGNIGRSGLNSRHHLLQLQVLLEQYPWIDTVVLMVGANDLLDRLSEGVRYDSRYITRPNAEFELLQESFFRYPTDQDQPFYKRTMLWEMFQRIVLSRQQKQYYQDNAGLFYIKKRKRRKNADMLIDALPDMVDALDEYARNIEAIIALANHHDKRLVLITQPSMWRGDLPDDLKQLLALGKMLTYERKANGKWLRVYYKASALEKGLALYNKKLLAITQPHNVESIDLSGMLAKDTTVFYDGVHFNENGARQVAQIIADYLLDNRKVELSGH